jgi:DNA mismatch repair protein MutS
LLIVTGPNMAGKSTYLRMAAQLLVMAQAGSFVPAASMRFSPVDMIFTRIGSADRIARGQSTFLVEMADAAKVLNSSTPRSLAVIDEVGRGTSTYDGLSLAWAMVEHLHSSPVHRPLTIFATHYHELTALGSRLPGAANVNVAVRESSGRVVFLYRVEDGATDRSYGLHVASMAGVPGHVVARAAEVLADLESGRRSDPEPSQPQLELPLEQPHEPVLEAIRALDPDSLSPRTALELVYQLKRMLE